ncbi:pseudouridine synthase [Hydrocarboniclastica marina]|nr:16S rRNA pseudouridine(516) synthase [Hydrocarboniclastica marina]
MATPLLLEPTPGMRLDYYLAHATTLSRKEAKRIIHQGRVSVAGQVERKTSTPVEADSVVCLDEQQLVLSQGHRYLMLNKPVGVISATEDGQHRTVIDLIPPALRRDLHPVGRLDRDTTGLILLTTDGQWSHRVSSPRGQCAKVYRAQLDQPLTAQARSRLEQGVMLKGETVATRPADVESIDDRTIRLRLTEGRYHQVKRMLAAVGNHVIALHRERVGSIQLDDNLPPGAYRELSKEEISGV